MDVVTDRSTGCIIIKWLSKCILRFLTTDEKKLYRQMELYIYHYLKVNKIDCDILYNNTFIYMYILHHDKKRPHYASFKEHSKNI